MIIEKQWHLGLPQDPGLNFSALQGKLSVGLHRFWGTDCFANHRMLDETDVRKEI